MNKFQFFQRLRLSLARVACFRVWFLFIVLMPANTSAQLMQNLSIGSPKAIALANAVTATGTGIDSIHYNPAALARYDKRRLHLKGLIAHFEIGAEFGEYFDEAEELAGFIDYESDPVPGSSGETTCPAIMMPFVGLIEPPFLGFPLGGMSYRPSGSKLTFATGTYSPAGFGYTRDPDDPASYSGQTVAMTRLTYLAPTVAMQLTDSLALGVSIGFSWQGLGLNLPARAPHVAIAVIEEIGNRACPNGATDEGVCESLGDPLGVYDSIGTLETEMEDALSLTFNVGLLWDPNPWLSIGFVYQSEGVGELEGDFKMSYEDSWTEYWSRQPDLLTSQSWFPQGASEEQGTATTELIQPQHASLGLSVQLTPSWRVNVDLKWTQTSAWDVMHFKFDQPIDLLRLAGLIQPDEVPDSQNLIMPRYYEDTTSWAVGMEYQWSDRLTLRWGVEDRPSGIPKDRQDVLFPVADSYFYGAGFAYQQDRDTLIEFGLGYLKSEADVPANSSYNANYTGYQEGEAFDMGTVIYNPYAGIDFKTYVEAYLFSISYQTLY